MRLCAVHKLTVLLSCVALHTAVNAGQFELCVTLVSDLLADVNACDEAQRSPLFYAVSHNFVDLVEFLLQAKANPDLLDQDQMRYEITLAEM